MRDGRSPVLCPTEGILCGGRVHWVWSQVKLSSATSSCVNMGKSLLLSAPQRPLLYNGIIIT